MNNYLKLPLEVTPPVWMGNNAGMLLFSFACFYCATCHTFLL